MRQLAKGGHISPRQKTSASGTQSSSDNGMPLSVRRHPNNTVCLPMLSENKKLLWVHMSQIDLQPDCVAELDEAFAGFPYLTQKQTTALAQRCSMHPDQVRMWFMARRVLYGVSWDYKDIREVQSKFKSSHKDDDDTNEEQTDGEMDDGGKKKNLKENEVESGVKKEARANEQKTKREKGRKAREIKTSTPKKQKGETTIVKRKKKRVRQKHHTKRVADEENMDISKDERLTCNESDGAILTKKNNKKQIKPPHENPVESDLLLGASFLLKPPIQTPQTIPVSENQTDLLDRADAPCNVPDMTPVNSSINEITEALAGLEEDHAEETDVEKLKGLAKINDSLVTANDPPALITQDGGEADKHTLPAQTHKNAKTQAQMKMMKMAFSQCQYPDREQYTQLSKWIGVPRSALVQWYGDTRYSLKKAKPRWMNEEEYNQALTNVKYRQYMNSLSRSQQGLSGGDETWIRMLDESNGFEDKKSVMVPLE